MNAAKSKKLSWAWESAAAVIALAGFVARCLPWRFVFSDGAVVMPGVDPYYHIWRARHLVQSFPFAPIIDPYINFPHGAPIPWPAGFDLMIALPGLLGAPISSLATWGSLLMPVLGALGVWLVWRLGKTIFDRPTGIVAALFAAFSVGFIHYSKIGRIDHHALVAPLSLAMFLAFLNALEQKNHKKAWSLAGAALAALALGSWIVTPPVYFIPVTIMVLVNTLSSKNGEARTAVTWGLMATVLLSTFVVIWAGDPRNLFSLYRPSILHLAAYAGFAVLGLACLKGKIFFVGTMVVMACFAGLSLLVFPQVVSQVKTAFEVASGASTAYTMATESSPLFFPNHIFSPMRPVLLYSYLAYFWPFFIGALLLKVKRHRELTPGKVLVLAWSIMGLLLMLTQERFGEYAAPALFIVTAWAMVTGFRIVKKTLLQASPVRRWVLGSSLAVALLIAIWPIPKGLSFLYSDDPCYYQRALGEFGQKLAKTLPSPLDSEGKPLWGLLTGWMDAHPLLETTEIPVAVSSFGTKTALKSNGESFGLLLSKDEESVFKSMEKRHLAYVVVSNQLNQAKAMAAMAGIKDPMVRITTGIDSQQRLYSLTEPLPSFMASILARLWLGDGSCLWQDGSEHEGLGLFRLVLESPTRQNALGMNTALLKAFQVVTGARIKGEAKAGSTVRLRLSLTTNTHRSFTYSRKTVAGENSVFSFTVPYPTHGGLFPCRATGPYRIKTGNKVITVDVSEQDVISGASVHVTP